MQNNKDATAVAGLIATFAAGWNKADGAMLAAAFAEDADFTAVNGLRVHGRDLIGEGHDELLSTIFRGVVLAANVLSVRFLRPDIAVAEADLTYPKGMALGVNRALAQYVAVRSGERWEIAVFRNMIPFERPMAGPVEQRVRAETGQV